MMPAAFCNWTESEEEFVRNLVLAVVALAGMASAQADGLSYSYAEGGFGMVDFDAINDEGDGYFIGGSLGLGTNWLGFVEYGLAEFDMSGATADVEEIQVGFGGHFPMSKSADFVGRIAYVDQSVEVSAPGFGSASADENGYMLSAGVRGMALERLDLMGAIEYVDVGDSDDTGLMLRGLYQFTDMFSLGARAGFSDDATEYGLFARFTF
jgi:outer membrane protein with beta-barrel domain